MLDIDNSGLDVRTVHCPPFSDQRMGTAGLRKKVAVFQQPHYLECFVQAVFNTLKLKAGSTLVLGGDGRYYNEIAIQKIIGLASAAGIRHLIIGRNGLLSTPAASNLIRVRGADGGFLLTASHNPGGPNGDFGIKFNTATGGQAPPQVTDAVFTASRTLSCYTVANLPLLDLSRTGISQIGPVRFEIVDPVDDYLRLMEQLFDFDRIAAWLRAGHRILFDALHGITGPYASQVLCGSLGASEDSILHAAPLPDFGGLHPDPNPVDARHLVEICAGPDSPDLVAASDGDGDRNMILGPGLMISPCDSVAMMLADSTKVPGYAAAMPGVARSMPTSRALDVVASALGIPCFETPTGWRYFCNLLEAGRIGLCGEESFGTGSFHAREKDGLWAVLFWLNLLAVRNEPLPDIASAHWQRYGRHYYQRHDYEIADAARADEVMNRLRANAGSLTGSSAGGSRIESADDFRYLDPVDGTEARHQGIRITLEDGSRIVYRLSGTGTEGALLRIYLERFEPDAAGLALDTTRTLRPVATLAAEIADLKRMTGLAAPTAIV
jgi:phosphoglucomutase